MSWVSWDGKAARFGMSWWTGEGWMQAGPQSGHVERQPGLWVWTGGRGLGGGESVGLGGTCHGTNVTSQVLRENR